MGVVEQGGEMGGEGEGGRRDLGFEGNPCLRKLIHFKYIRVYSSSEDGFRMQSCKKVDSKTRKNKKKK